MVDLRGEGASREGKGRSQSQRGWATVIPFHWLLAADALAELQYSGTLGGRWLPPGQPWVDGLSFQTFWRLHTILFFFFFFSGPPQLWHMEVPRLGVESDLQLLVYITATAMGGGFWAMSATYTTAHGNPRSLTHWVRPGIKPATSWILVGFITTEPQWELPAHHSCSELVKTNSDGVRTPASPPASILLPGWSFQHLSVGP